ncbi:MAG: gliding motility-associated C-terminal domain-containing protein, partial [Flavobacteriales bacterium]
GPWAACLTKQYYFSSIGERVLRTWNGTHNFYFARRFTVNGEMNGCQSSTSVNIHFWEQPGIPNAGEDQQLAVTNSLLNGEFDGIGEIHWESSSDAVFIGEPSNLSTEVSNLSIGWNELILFQSNGTCPVNSDTLRINVLQLEIPTGFSPNGDNVNDVFYVTGLEQYAEAQIVVFNRWGNEVYKNTDFKNDWGGLNNNGNQLEEDTYYIVLTLDNDEYKGYVVIKK